MFIISVPQSAHIGDVELWNDVLNGGEQVKLRNPWRHPHGHAAEQLFAKDEEYIKKLLKGG